MSCRPNTQLPARACQPWLRAALRGGVALGSALPALAACTSFEPGSDELATEEVSVESLAPGHDWQCLPTGAPAPGPLYSRPEEAPVVVQSIRMLSFVTEAAIPNVVVRACAQRDLECASPVTSSFQVRADGWVDLPLYEGFVGYLEITGEGFIPTALFYAAPITTDQAVYDTPIGLVERNALPVLSQAAGVEQSPEQGIVVLRALDCQRRDALGVRYSIDSGGTPWYLLGGIPSRSVSETTDSGLGGFLNVPPGIAVVSAALATPMRDVVPPTSILIRPGWMTVVRFVPRALP